MNLTFEDNEIELAASLIYHGLNSKSRPFTNSEYNTLIKRYKEDIDIQDLHDTLKAYSKNEDPLVLINIKESIESIKNNRKAIESGYNGNIPNYDAWYTQHVLKITNKRYY